MQNFRCDCCNQEVSKYDVVETVMPYLRGQAPRDCRQKCLSRELCPECAARFENLFNQIAAESQQEGENK